MAENLRIPPLIQQWIDEVNNPKNKPHIKDNYVMMLEHVALACNETITTYRNNSFTPVSKKR